MGVATSVPVPILLWVLLNKSLFFLFIFFNRVVAGIFMVFKPIVEFSTSIYLVLHRNKPKQTKKKIHYSICYQFTRSINFANFFDGMSCHI